MPSARDFSVALKAPPRGGDCRHLQQRWGRRGEDVGKGTRRVTGLRPRAAGQRRAPSCPVQIGSSSSHLANPASSSVLFKGETFSQQHRHLVPTLEKVNDSPGPAQSDCWPFPLFFDLCFHKFQIPPPTSIFKKGGRERKSRIMTLSRTAFLQNHE